MVNRSSKQTFAENFYENLIFSMSLLEPATLCGLCVCIVLGVLAYLLDCKLCALCLSFRHIYALVLFCVTHTYFHLLCFHSFALWYLYAWHSSSFWLRTRFYTFNIYLLKVSYRSTEKRHKIYSKLTIQTLEGRHWRCYGVFTVNLEQISNLFLVFLPLTMNK